MSGCVVQVWLAPEARALRGNGEPVPFELFETEFDDLAGFLEAVAEGEMICASLLITARGEGGARVVRRRVASGFPGRVVLRAEVPSWRIVEEAEQ